MGKVFWLIRLNSIYFQGERPKQKIISVSNKELHRKKMNSTMMIGLVKSVKDSTIIQEFSPIFSLSFLPFFPFLPSFPPI